MKSMNEGPDKNQETNKGNLSSTQSNLQKKDVYSNKDSDKTRNYMEGDDNVNGPNWDKLSTAADGDTTVNAGVFK